METQANHLNENLDSELHLHRLKPESIVVKDLLSQIIYTSTRRVEPEWGLQEVLK
jgi:hypothetical protein